MNDRMRGKMELLKERIKKDGIVDGKILKVDSFLNHQVDVLLLAEIAKEFKKRFEGESITKVLTLETSGIPIATMVAATYQVPMVVARKTVGKNIEGEVYSTQVESYSKHTTFEVLVGKKFLSSEDKILMIDDILSNGCALLGLTQLILDAGAKIVGAGIVIEKGFQIGGELMRTAGVRVESLVNITEITESGEIIFA